MCSSDLRPPSSSGAERVSGQTIQAGFVPLNPCAPIIVAHGSGSSPSTLSLSRLSANPASFAHRDSNWDESLLVSRGYTREAAIRPNKHHRTGNEDWRETAKSAGDNGVEGVIPPFVKNCTLSREPEVTTVAELLCAASGAALMGSRTCPA